MNRQDFLPAVPAVILLSLLTARVPMAWSHAREVAGYFQARGFLAYGLDSYFYLTPLESYSALHLHSTLSAPLVGLGYLEGGRLISLLAALVGVALLAAIARQLNAPQVAVVTPLALWLHPLFIRFAYAWMPETVSIALTTGSVYAILRYLNSKRNQWYLASLVCIIAGITNHMWEATMVVPIVALLITQKEYVRAAVTSLFTVGAVSVVWYLTGLQPTGTSNLTRYGTHAIGIQFLGSGEFWFSHLSPHPLYLAVTLTLPASILAGVYWTWRAYQTRLQNATPVLLSAWFGSALALPLFLARGYSIHPYYAWAQLAPLALSGGFAIRYATSYLPWNRDRMTTATLSSLLIGIVVYLLFFEVGILSGMGVMGIEKATIPAVDNNLEVPEEEIHSAARKVRSSDVTSIDEVRFVGDWGQTVEGASYQDTRELTRLLIYSGLPVKDRDLNDRGQSGPKFGAGEGCQIKVIKSGSEITVKNCSEQMQR